MADRKVEELLRDLTPEQLIELVLARSSGKDAKATYKEAPDKKVLPSKYVYYFSPAVCEGRSDMVDLLGGKGANVAEMARLGLPVPPGFTITCQVCSIFLQNKKQYPEEVKTQIAQAMKRLETETNKTFGDTSNPLLVSVRSGASETMPGMMDTVLNLGLNDDAVEGLANLTNNPRFAWDTYRRFISMFGDVVKGIGGENFEHVLDKIKGKKGYQHDTELDADCLKDVVTKYKTLYKKMTGEPFPQDPYTQLWDAINAVFGSWDNPRAKKYRQIHDMKGMMGTAVNIQAMVFGNNGPMSATGVCFSRNPSNGENEFYGEWLVNAQGQDVVAGIRTPQQITKSMSEQWAAENGISEEDRIKDYPSMEEAMPETYQELTRIGNLLQYHYRDMQDMEFTIDNGKLNMLQTKSGKRTAMAAVKIAVDMVKEGLLEDREAILRVDPKQLDQLLHPMIDPRIRLRPLAKGLPASPGAALGQIVFTAEDAEEWARAGKKVILVRMETSPEDVGGMHVAQGILSCRGGMTSHAAVVARGMGRCCVSGVAGMRINMQEKTCMIGNKKFREGDYITLNGSTGQVVAGQVPLMEAAMTKEFKELMDMCAKYRRLKVRVNADNPLDCEIGVRFGAEGVGLCRTEHMFFTGSRVQSMREMILADTFEQRQKALEKLLPMQKEDFLGIFKVMKGKPVTIRLLDPPLHEFVPPATAITEVHLLALALGVSEEKLKVKIEALTECNPMMGHRGCRLGITTPAVYNMQTQAIFEAACELKSAGFPLKPPEIMVPLVGKVEELIIMKRQLIETAEKTMAKMGTVIEYTIGTMIEVPRACVTADLIAKEADFFSFGTNDLTQMGCGFSRDDAGKFLGEYVQQGIYESDPFSSIDQEGVGELLKIAVAKGRSVKPKLKMGICGEHGGDPQSIHFFHKIPLHYVSCSAYRVPIAMLAAAQAAVMYDDF